MPNFLLLERKLLLSQPSLPYRRAVWFPLPGVQDLAARVTREATRLSRPDKSHYRAIMTGSAWGANRNAKISPAGRAPWDQRSGDEDREPAIRPVVSLTSTARFGRSVSGSTWTGITGMLRRGSRNGNPLEADSALLLEVFFPVNAIVISDQPPPTCQGRDRCRHSTIAPSSSVLDLGVDEKLQPRSKSHFYFSLRSDHKRLHDPCKEEGARGFMTHWLHTDHYWLFRGDQGESTLGTERYIGMLRNCYYRASLHIVPCSRKSRPHLVAFHGHKFFSSKLGLRRQQR